MNKAFFIGRVVKDPEIIMADKVDIAKFTIAVDRNSKEKQTDFINITAFNKLANICEEHLKKGQLVSIESSVKTGSYEKDDKKIYTIDFIAREIKILIWDVKNKGEAEHDEEE